MPRFRLNGRHVAVIFMTFFAIVIAVNLVMASYAVGGFGGTVVDNSYVASQRFNGWLAQARQQQALGWRQQSRLDPDRHLVLTMAGPHPAAISATVFAIAEHPLGRSADIPLRFVQQARGKWRSVTPLPAGRWIVHWTIQADGQEKRFLERNG